MAEDRRDSHPGYELGELLSWYISTGVFLAPVVMVIGAVLVLFSDPVLGQKIANSRDQAAMDRQRVRGTLLAEKAAHESRRIVHNIRLGAQRQMAIEAKKYYKSPVVQTVLQETAVTSLQDVLRQAGINVSPSTHIFPGSDRSDIDASEVIQQSSSKSVRSDSASGK